MAHVYKNACGDTTATTGTGTYTLDDSAPTGMQDFVTALADGDTCTYSVTDGTDLEIGLGTWTEASRFLARTTIYYSTNAGSAVNWSAGSKNVRMTFTSDRHCDSVDGIGIGSLTDTTIPEYDSSSGTLVDSPIVIGSSWATVDRRIQVDIPSLGAGDGTGNQDGVSIYQPAKLAGDGPAFEYEAQNASSSRTTYARTSARIVTNTASSEDGQWVACVVVSGTITDIVEVDEDGLTVVKGGLAVEESGAGLKLKDTGGGTDDKTIHFLVDTGRMEILSLNDDGSTRKSAAGMDLGTGNLVLGATAYTGSARLYVSGERAQITNNHEWMCLTTGSGDGFSWFCDASNDGRITLGGTDAITFDSTNDEIEFHFGVHFGSDTTDVSSNAATLDFGTANHHELTLASATGACSITLTPPEGQTAGTFTMTQDNPARAVTFSSSATLKWPVAEETWENDTASSYRVFCWRYVKSKGHIVITYTDEIT